jgi:hypothetical protein
MLRHSARKSKRAPNGAEDWRAQERAGCGLDDAQWLSPRRGFASSSRRMASCFPSRSVGRRLCGSESSIASGGSKRRVGFSSPGCRLNESMRARVGLSCRLAPGARSPGRSRSHCEQCDQSQQQCEHRQRRAEMPTEEVTQGFSCTQQERTAPRSLQPIHVISQRGQLRWRRIRPVIRRRCIPKWSVVRVHEELRSNTTPVSGPACIVERPKRSLLIELKGALHWTITRRGLSPSRCATGT